LIGEELLLKPTEHLAVYMLGLHVSPKASIQDNIMRLVTDVNYLGWLMFFIKYQTGKERLPATR
jgi:hypothetical protein